MYKVSKFNLCFEQEGKNFLYNSHTGCFVILDEDYQRSLESIRETKSHQVPELHIQKLKEAGFIVDQKTDEYKIYKYMTNQSKYSNEYLGLTIATTLQCNFRCPYCYEEHVDSYFDEKKEEDLLNFIINNLEGRKHLSITWYGGEPLLQKDMIDRVSTKINKVCDERNIDYSASMVSNGYLLTRNVAETLVNNNKVSFVQITLDGGPETHNLTRILRNGNGSFDKILENIKQICDIINVGIRVNVSQNNVKDVYGIFPILMANGLNNKVSIYFSPVTAHEGACQSVSESCMLTEQFAKWESELIDYADSLGFNMGKLYPTNLGGSVCTAVTNNTFVIDSEGDLYKCWNEVGKANLKVGTLVDGIINKERYVKWVEWDFPDKCLNCSIFPLCKGRCPEMSLEGESFECNQLKYNIIDRLIRYFNIHSLSQQQVNKVFIDV
ncbi:radical SAM/SPASM domain-containing protein [Paenibacillus selenitireducens]|uniref:Radical SAM/SPASM domain-containing protein n=1 Tax=Paenibacillus selenitireducens TaxID=1324314 RepID=A0A1T2X2H5_9BACL|nr:radical SAM protein [Paenibacillus selenitireducens]OPA74074.1 radical SAM/SPASM domain-containing protein [Paenibacillus selenitireducens]